MKKLYVLELAQNKKGMGITMEKNTISFLAALWIGKLAKNVQRLLGMNASYFPGKLAIKLCPNFIGHMQKPDTIIAVTGTNGKTTVCNLILDVLADNGYDVLNNRAGSNINAGIASSLLSDSTLTGKTKKKIAVFEVDERSSVRIYPYLTPTYLACTNLFRDSISRNAHPEFISNIISKSVPEETKLILNADDLISSNLAPKNARVYYSISRLPSDTEECENIINDMRICPNCHAKLTYRYVRYHHIGNAYCPDCGFSSQEADYKADVDFESGFMHLSYQEEQANFSLVSDSIFNTYNQLTAICVLREFGLSMQAIHASFEKLHIMESRYSCDEVDGYQVITHLAKGKNPIACSCVFDYILHDPGKKTILIMTDDVGDRKVSSENITWLYDADFEKLNDDSISQIIVSGVRCLDYRLRLLIAGVPEEKIFYTVEEQNMPNQIDFSKATTFFILHDNAPESVATSLKVKEKLIERIHAHSSHAKEHQNKEVSA